MADLPDYSDALPQLPLRQVYADIARRESQVWDEVIAVGKQLRLPDKMRTIYPGLGHEITIRVDKASHNIRFVDETEAEVTVKISPKES